MENIFLNRIPSIPDHISSYDPFPDLTGCLADIPIPLRDRLVSDGEKYLQASYEPISATDYMDFVRTGDRAAFEKKYFGRRYQLCALITAGLVQGMDTFIDDITNGIYHICEESSWVLPAHNTYIRDTPQLILPDTKRPVLDLFACESAALLAMTYHLLKDELDRVSCVIADRIKDEINKRIIKPYIEDHFWWMGNGDEPMCNWTPWCTQNVLLAAFLLPDDEDVRRKVIEKAAYSLDCFLKDYGDDGCCDEGAQYYRHAGLCMFHCIDILNAVTSGAFGDIWDIPKIKNIASYIVNVRAGGGYYVNFSDCSARAGSMGVREFLFGKACRLSPLMDAAAEDLYEDLYGGGDIFASDSMRMNLYFRILTVCKAGSVLRYHEDNRDGATSVPGDIFYPSVGLMVARSSRFVLAVKAGDNNDNHNHNDTGSFTLYLDGRPLFVDIGVETYSRKTFSPDRYDIWTMQSGYHNLPTLAGLDQMAGDRYRATDVDCHLEDGKKSMSMHMEKAYPLPDKLSSSAYYIRNVALDTATETVTVTDTSNCPDVILNFITYEALEATAKPGVYRIGNALISPVGADIMSTETLPINDARLRLAWDHDLCRIRLRMTASEFVMQIRPAT